MKDLLQYLINAWNQAGFTTIASYLSILAGSLGVVSFLWSLATKLRLMLQQRKLLRDLHPFYTAQEIQRATQYYIETMCQNVAPSKADEPIHDLVFGAKENGLSFFLSKAFQAQADTYQFYIVLADSGMGKTTFLINLYLRYINQFRRSPYRIKLFPLGFPGIDKEIEKIPDQEKRQTILLLDAFDEDMLAVHDYKTRLEELVQKVIHFREVVITCRTQFFPREEEEPKETGVMRYGVEGGERVFSKFYLSPFDEKDIQTYLKKRFSWFQHAKRQAAARIVLSCKNLMVRPMLLSYIDVLLQSQHTYTATYKVYAELINKWVEREAKKIPSNRRDHYMEELYQFSREIAVHLYRHREERQGSLIISNTEIQPFAGRHDIQLSEMEMKSKSLLNRNARGDYKFSHKSILEYFLAEEAFFNEEFRQELKFEGMDQAETFFVEMIREDLTIPFFNRGTVNGEYCLQDGNPRMLTKLPEKLLPDITALILREWKTSDNVLLLRGLKSLKRIGISGFRFSAEQERILRHALPECTFFQVLRSQPLTVSEKDAAQTFQITGIPGKPKEYIHNKYDEQGDVVQDHATGLMWQKSGSSTLITYKQAESYIKKLNRGKFAGYNDWRLPTILELMSLLEPEAQSDGLYINPIFNNTQSWCWSADKALITGGSSSAAWNVTFGSGLVNWLNVRHKDYVRAVRSRQ